MTDDDAVIKNSSIVKMYTFNKNKKLKVGTVPLTLVLVLH